MPGQTGLSRRLSYADVVATVALFVAVGGGAYAAVELPAGSVHTVQLAPGAVTRSKLAFALGSSFTSRVERTTLPGPRSSCPPGATSCPPPGTPAARIATTTLNLSRPANILVLVSAGFGLTAPQSQTGTVELVATVDGHSLGTSFGITTGSNGNTLPYQGVIATAKPGRHRIALLATALTDGTASTFVSRVSLAAIAIPPG